MTTGKDYGLPEEYADWVEVPFHLVNIGDNYVTTHFIHYPNGPLEKGFSIVGIAKYFVAPKPKPTLPDVKPGAVVSWRANTSSSRRRGTLLSDGRWQVAIRNGDSGCILGAHTFWSKEDVLLDVDDDGFTVELDGLE